MAKADLRLDVETKYNGDGLNKLKQGVKEADTQIKKAS